MGGEALESSKSAGAPRATEGEAKPRRADQPIDRMLAIMEEVVGLRRAASVAEIAEGVELPVPSTHRIVHQLVERGLLKRQLGTTRLLPGSRLVALSADVLQAAMLADDTNRVLTRLSADIGEHCHVGVMADGEVLYVDSARSGRGHGLLFEPGRRAPLHCTSIGKIWLAHLPAQELSRWIENAALPRMTANTIVDAAVLASTVAEVRERGWASSDEELTEGVVGCAVPVHDRKSRLIAALGISVPKARASLSSLEALIPKLREAAGEIGSATSQLDPETKNN